MPNVVRSQLQQARGLCENERENQCVVGREDPERAPEIEAAETDAPAPFQFLEQ